MLMLSYESFNPANPNSNPYLKIFWMDFLMLMLSCESFNPENPDSNPYLKIFWMDFLMLLDFIYKLLNELNYYKCYHFFY